MNSSLEELTGKVISKINLHGGDINDVYLLQCKNRSYVLKENRHNLKELFAKEASGLGLLKKADIPIPEVYYFDEKYLFEFNIRYDGSSRFGPDNPDANVVTAARLPDSIDGAKVPKTMRDTYGVTAAVGQGRGRTSHGTG